MVSDEAQSIATVIVARKLNSIATLVIAYYAVNVSLAAQKVILLLRLMIVQVY
jgi:hypothetical protein